VTTGKGRATATTLPGVVFDVSTAERSPAPALGLRAADTRRRILETARSAFLEHGYGGAHFDKIAKEAGLSRTSIYEYFASKRDLLVTLGNEAYVESDRALKYLDILRATPTRQKMAEWVQLQLEQFDKHGAFLTVWTEAAHGDEELHRSGTSAERSYARRIGSAFRSIQPALEADAETIGLAALGMIHRVWYFDRDNGSGRPHLVEQLAELFQAMTR
jgi:AcrR family transcriptional regulator